MLTDKDYINMHCSTPPEPDACRLATVRELLDIQDKEIEVLAKSLDGLCTQLGPVLSQADTWESNSKDCETSESYPEVSKRLMRNTKLFQELSMRVEILRCRLSL